MDELPTREALFEELQAKVKILNGSVWVGQADWPTVQNWLSQFTQYPDLVDDEQAQALYLLTHFLYFGTPEIRALLRSLYRDLICRHLTTLVRRQRGDTIDRAVLMPAVAAEVEATRFVAIGNPSESGALMLYFLRQENGLDKNLFVNALELFDRSKATTVLATPSVSHYIFVDDLCASGEQAERYTRAIATEIRQLSSSAKIYYYALFGSEGGLDRLRGLALFDRVEAVVELDSSFKCFEPDSRIYKSAGPAHDVAKARDIFERYGTLIYPKAPLGWEDSQLLLGFSHNTPDNTLPVFWVDGRLGAAWSPIFRRYSKYGT